MPKDLTNWASVMPQSYVLQSRTSKPFANAETSCPFAATHFLRFQVSANQIPTAINIPLNADFVVGSSSRESPIVDPPLTLEPLRAVC
jgi:hypothetical protein